MTVYLVLSALTSRPIPYQRLLKLTCVSYSTRMYSSAQCINITRCSHLTVPYVVKLKWSTSDSRARLQTSKTRAHHTAGARGNAAIILWWCHALPPLVYPSLDGPKLTIPPPGRSTLRYRNGGVYHCITKLITLVGGYRSLSWKFHQTRGYTWLQWRDFRHSLSWDVTQRILVVVPTCCNR
jgi:hypothetical protein